MRTSVVWLKTLPCSPVQSSGSASGPLVASYTGLAISLNPGIQILQNRVMPKKLRQYFFFFCLWDMLRPNVACFLSGENCLLPAFLIYPRYLTCCFEICAFLPAPPGPPFYFLGDPIAADPKEIKDLSGIWSEASMVYWRVICTLWKGRFFLSVVGCVGLRCWVWTLLQRQQAGLLSVASPWLL